MLMRAKHTRTLDNHVARHKFSPSSINEGSTPIGKGRQPVAFSVPGKKPLRVFIADDSLLIVERLIELLATIKGVQIVGSAQTVKTSIKGIRQLSPDLLILDFQMPDGTGIDVLKAINQGTTPPLVMMLTNFTDPIYRMECLQRGADYFFDKSLDIERVIETCRDLVAVTAMKSGTVEE